METKSLGRELVELDRDLEQRQRADIPAPTVELIAGLVAGMRLVGRTRNWPT